MATKRSVFALDGDQDFGIVSNQITKAKSPSSSPNSSAECDVNHKSDLLALEEVESADHSSDSSSDDDEDIDALTKSIIATLGLIDPKREEEHI